MTFNDEHIHKSKITEVVIFLQTIRKVLRMSQIGLGTDLKRGRSFDEETYRERTRKPSDSH